ncbi:MAG: hypothetical protein HeimC3_27360 [Candidatus Heimdallarchaeota archaeon LC_3]|nr:MAG: hypothetical protein HeimC3_27360 [Candidatus Heimdallarchaeota archaeon LC_3]
MSDMGSEKKPYYLREPFVFLINPGLLPNDISIIKDFPVGKILPEFVKVMRENRDNELDFRLLGNSLASGVKIHRNKIELSIKHHLNIEKKEKRRKEREEQKNLDIQKGLPFHWSSSPLFLYQSDNQSVFFEELMFLFEKELEREERLAKKISKGGDSSKKRRRRKLTADGLSTFEYTMNFNLTEVDVLVEDIHKIILISIHSTQEVDFNVVMDRHIEKMRLKVQERVLLERVRVLLSILYLVQDGRIEAWEEEETFNIYIKLPQKKSVVNEVSQ